MRENCLYILVPCYNEEEVLPETSRRLAETCADLQKKGKISPESRVVFIDDGSRDDTWAIIARLHGENSLFEGIRLSRNRGHQNALLAGLLTAKDYADVTISLDADLQDDVGAMEEMLDRYQEGCEIVYGVRSHRKTDSWGKRVTAEGFYHFMEKMGAEVVFNHADYRLMSRRALDALAEYEEVNLFLRGIVPMLGYKTAVVTYDRSARFAGTSKYSLRKMFGLALNGITSLSVRPIRMVTALGGILSGVGFVLTVIAIILAILGRCDGWFAVLACLWVLAGAQILAIGIVGEYVGKIYLESKRRPHYHIMEILHRDES